MIFVGTNDHWKMPLRYGQTVREDNVCFAGPFANERDAISFAVKHDLDGFWFVRYPNIDERFIAPSARELKP